MLVSSVKIIKTAFVYLLSQYIYYDSKLLAAFVYFVEIAKTSLRAVWPEQNAQYNLFPPMPARKDLNVLQLMSS